MEPITINELREVQAFAGLPAEHLSWIIERSEQQEFADGDNIYKTGEPIETMWILVEGNIAFYMDVNGRLVYYFTFANDDVSGGVGGVLPYSRLTKSPGYSYAVGRTRVIGLHKKYFHELEQLNPELIQRLIGYMTNRARAFATVQLQQEKVSSLGKLAAGIAHELNNPAAAITRTSEDLHKRLLLNYSLTENLLRLHVSPDHIRSIREMASNKTTSLKLTTMQRLTQEDDLSDWLEDHGISNSRPIAETFADAGVTTEDLEAIQANAGKDTLEPALAWLENILCSERLIKDLSDASGRISGLVGAIKSHVHMDRMNDLQPTSINQDLENTLTLLGHKLRDKNINIVRNYKEDIAKIDVYVGELNQVWTNLIDNAIYAMERDGELTICTSSDQKNITVKIIDNGSGISPQVIGKIFDPFFTTKKMGDGTGIGLDLVSRIVKKHCGEIKVNSKPGKTEFSVCLPFNPVAPAR